MENAYVLVLIGSFILGMAGGVVYSWSLARRLRLVELEIAELFGKVTRETKARASETRWSKPPKEDLQQIVDKLGNTHASAPQMDPDAVARRFYGKGSP